MLRTQTSRANACGRIPLAALALLLCFACNTHDDSGVARQAYEDLREGRYEAVEARLEPHRRTAQNRAGMERIRATLIPPGEPVTVRRLSAEGFTTPRERHLMVRDEYGYTARVVIATTRIAWRDDEPARITALSIRTYSRIAIAREAPKLSWTDATRTHRYFAAVALSSVGLMAFAVVGVLVTRGFRRKWLWCLVSLVGVGVFRLDWGEGEWTFEPAFVSIVGAGVSRGPLPFDPWIAYFHVPAGALLVLALLWPIWADIAPDRSTDPT